MEKTDRDGNDTRQLNRRQKKSNTDQQKQKMEMGGKK